MACHPNLNAGVPAVEYVLHVLLYPEEQVPHLLPAALLSAQGAHPHTQLPAVLTHHQHP